MNKNLINLAEYRDILLTAEMAAWLHMIGKYSKEFIGGDFSTASQLPKGISENLARLFKEDLLQNFCKKLPIQDFQTSLIIEEFISKHALGNSDMKKEVNVFNKLLNDSHGRGSGTEKGLLRRDAYSYQNNSSIRISTAFGYEAEPIDVNEIDLSSKKLYTFIENAIVEVKKLLQNSKTDNLKKWNVLRREVINVLNKHFTKAIGDTRRPINDVTLWDQTVSSVAFFRSDLAEVFINGYKDPFDRKYTFRYLYMTFDGEKYLGKGIGIGDIASRRKLIDKAFDRVKLIIEVEYPLGLEIYRDTNGITFLIPKLSEELKIDDLIIKEGNTLKQRISDEVIAITNGEITPYFYISEKSSRNLYNLGSMISKKPEGNIPSLKLRNNWIHEAEVCSSCLIKPVDSTSTRNKKKKLCEECSKRITNRAKQWFNNRKEQTIWIDEIADSNSKVALIACSFSLGNWVNNTENLSTFRNLKKNKEINFSFSEFMNDFTKFGKLQKMSNFKKIVNRYILDALKTTDGLYDFIVKSEDLGYNRILKKHEKLALSIWRKPPSFARIRRVWETTSRFWNDALAEIREKIVDTKNARLIIKVKSDNINHLDNNNAYEVETNGARFTVFLYKNYFENGVETAECIVIENPYLLAQKMGLDEKQNDLINNVINEIKKKIYGKTIRFYDPNSPSRVLVDSEVYDFEIDTCSYSPVIEITKDPERFMVLVPANKALEIAKTIKEKYEKEMGKVRNRLPLNLGIVYAKYHTALPAIMDAGRRLMRINNKEEKWTLTERPEEYSDHFELSFENGQIWKIPSKMGDCSEDIWYPYFYVVNEDKDELGSRPLSFKGPSGDWLIHVSELKKGDKILVIPSYFDFEYLSSASQRFEISYDDKNRRRSNGRKQRPYYLDELNDIEKVWETLSTKLSNSQIKKMNSLVEKRRRDWADSLKDNDESFIAYIEYVINNLKWKSPLEDKERKKIIDFCINGKLADVLEIHMSILKDKSEVAG